MIEFRLHGNAKNLYGQKFGKLSPLYPSPNRKGNRLTWRCECDCGNFCDVMAGNLTSGYVKSCGCLYKSSVIERKAFNDLSGQRFGKLLVLSVIHDKGKTHGKHKTWKCICDCGMETIVDNQRLLGGHTKSCGCIKRTHRILPYGKAGLNQVFATYKQAAKNRCLEFSLSKEDFENLTQMNCFYCGSSPSNKCIAYKNQNGAYIYNGIDRIDSSQGYILSNCVPSCKICNRAKSNMSKHEFLEWIKLAYEFNTNP